MRKNKTNKEKVLELGLDLEKVFNYFNLSVEEQVDFINSNFKKGIFEKDMESAIGYSWTVITDSIRPTYSKIGGFYIPKQENKKVVNNNQNYVTTDDFNNLKEELKELKEIIKTMSNINDNNNKRENVLLLDVRNDICKETITKQYKIDKELSERFDKFAEDNCILNKQVLISTALEQFLDRYSK